MEKLVFLLFAALIVSEMFVIYEYVAINVVPYVLINIVQLILLFAVFLRVEVFNDDAPGWKGGRYNSPQS